MTSFTQSVQGAMHPKIKRLVDQIPLHFLPSLPSLFSVPIDVVQVLFVKNKDELTKNVAAAGGAIQHLDGDDTYYLRWYATQGGNRFPEAQHNLVEHQSLPAKQLWSVVATVTQYFRSSEQPFSWVVGPQDHPHLELALLKHGLVLAETQFAMVCDLEQDGSPKCQKGSSVWLMRMDAASRTVTKYASIKTSHPEYTIQPVVSKDMVDSWVEAWAYMAPPTSEGVLHWKSIYQTLFAVLSPTQFEMIVAKTDHPNPGDEDGVIGTAYIHYFKGIASLHCVTVKPDHRGKGVEPGLLHIAAKLAKSKGYSIMTTTSTYQGRAILFTAGYRQIGFVKQYCYNPKNKQEQTEDAVEIKMNA
ncbi:hypothetical protein F5Y18DRAFT_434948 [Xylariaceae sp. FL1019]|nr:hypothetical protein F5Y18DRAFT_434948 [Xylariaceae sp. FL1019]